MSNLLTGDKPQNLAVEGEFEGALNEQTFNTKPVVPDLQVKPPEQAFVREIDLQDGRGKQVFKADTLEGLVDQLVKAQENATRKIAELAGNKPITPEKTAPWKSIQLNQPKALSSTEQLEVLDLLNTNPEQAFDLLVEYRIGASPSAFAGAINKINELYAQQAANEAGIEFMSEHEEDYEPTIKNRKAIQELLLVEELPVTKTNLEYAFQKLSTQNKLDKPKVDAPVIQAPAPQVPQVHNSVLPPVTLSDRFGQRSQEQSQNGNLDVNALQKLSVAEMRDALSKHFRSGGH